MVEMGTFSGPQTVSEKPSNTVGTNWSFPPSEADTAVPIGILAAAPLPTFRCGTTGNFSPKAVFKRDTCVSSHGYIIPYCYASAQASCAHKVTA